MRISTTIVAVLFCLVTLNADDRSVVFDKNFDFSTVKTFAVHDVRTVSIRPEIKNPLVAGQVADAIRKTLTAKGLTEATGRPDVVVDSVVTTRPVGRGGFEATLVIDLMTGTPAKPVWHGVYIRTAVTAQKLAEKLPDNASKLLSEYPPKKK